MVTFWAPLQPEAMWRGHGYRTFWVQNGPVALSKSIFAYFHWRFWTIWKWTKTSSNNCKIAYVYWCLEHVCEIVWNSLCLLMFWSMCVATLKMATALQPHALLGLWLRNHYIRSFGCILCRWEMEAHQTLRIPAKGEARLHLALCLLMFREHVAQKPLYLLGVEHKIVV